MKNKNLIALQPAKIVHEKCKEAPHDIGMILADKVEEILFLDERNEFEKILDKQYKFDLYESDVCLKCSNHPKNGGNGICNCILGTPQFR